MLILLFVCLCGGSWGQQMLTYYDKTPMTWTDAQAFCRKHHTDLPTALDLEENVTLTKDSWLGLHRRSAEAPWKWSAGDVLLNYNAPWENKPNQDEHCVYKQASDKGNWSPKSCLEERKFFCVDQPIFLVWELKTWEEALEHCRSIQKKHTIPHELAILATVEEQKKAQTIIQAVNRYQVWVGLRFLGDQWMWLSGKEEPNGKIQSCPLTDRCGTLRVNVTAPSPLNTKKCHKRTFFLCSTTQSLPANR